MADGGLRPPGAETSEVWFNAGGDETSEVWGCHWDALRPANSQRILSRNAFPDRMQDNDRPTIPNPA